MIPALTGHSPPANNTRALLALPTRLGGIGIVNPLELRHHQQESAVVLCQPQVAMIEKQAGDVLLARDAQHREKKGRQQEIRREQKLQAKTITASLPLVQH